jgi:DNA-binding transcriptional LysR family regulator
MIDLQSLRHAVLVADHHSFRKAAIALGVHQSAIGRRVRSLEDVIGVSIFERRSRGAYFDLRRGRIRRYHSQGSAGNRYRHLRRRNGRP